MQGRRVKIVPISPDSELAYFLGFAVGDGSFSHRTISIHQSLKEKNYLPVESLVTRLSRKLGGGGEQIYPSRTPLGFDMVQ